MLNRRLSNYIFYGSLVLIIVIIILVRMFTLGKLLDTIDSTDAENISIQKRIDRLEELVQENKGIQTSHLYELYDYIPNVYSGDELSNRIVAILEKIGVSEDGDFGRDVTVLDVDVSSSSEMYEVSQDYYVVEVQVSFSTDEMDIVTAFIDQIYASEQLFILREVNYTFEEENVISTIEINFYAIYDVDQPIEEES